MCKRKPSQFIITEKNVNKRLSLQDFGFREDLFNDDFRLRDHDDILGIRFIVVSILCIK